MSIPQTTCDRVFSRLPQAGRLRFAAAFRYRFGKIGKENHEPQPDRQLRHETAQLGLGRENSEAGYDSANHGHKHDRVLYHQPWVQLLERVAYSRTDNVPVEKRCRFLRHNAELLRNVRLSLTPRFS